MPDLYCPSSRPRTVCSDDDSMHLCDSDDDSIPPLFSPRPTVATEHGFYDSDDQEEKKDGDLSNRRHGGRLHLDSDSDGSMPGLCEHNNDNSDLDSDSSMPGILVPTPWGSNDSSDDTSDDEDWPAHIYLDSDGSMPRIYAPT
jgi:hypothetical protein